MPPKKPIPVPANYHARVKETDDVAGTNVRRVAEPAAWAGASSPELRLKGVPLVEGLHYTRSGGELEFVHPIASSATVELFDGASKVWEWTADGGDAVGS